MVDSLVLCLLTLSSQSYQQRDLQPDMTPHSILQQYKQILRGRLYLSRAYCIWYVLAEIRDATIFCAVCDVYGTSRLSSAKIRLAVRKGLSWRALQVLASSANVVSFLESATISHCQAPIEAGR